MIELTFEEFCNKPLQYVLGFTGDAGAKRLYRNEELKSKKKYIQSVK